MTQEMIFVVDMYCGGCSGAVDRVLKKLDGVEKYEVSLENQTAHVWTDLDFQSVYNTIAKTGKKVNSATVDGEPRELQEAA